MYFRWQVYPGPLQGRAAGVEGTLQVPDTTNQTGPGQTSPWQHVRWTTDGETGQCRELQVCGQYYIEGENCELQSFYFTFGVVKPLLEYINSEGRDGYHAIIKFHGGQFLWIAEIL